MTDDALVRLMRSGSAVGSFPSARNRLVHVLRQNEISAQEDEPVPPRPRSSKQGPSRRKLRRWDNDKFIGIAAELAKAGHPHIAQAFARGESETSFYLRANDPRYYRSVFAELAQDKDGDYDDVKARFVRGEVADRPTKTINCEALYVVDDDALTKFNEIDGRLQQAVFRACRASFPTKVLSGFESYLLSVFTDNDFQDCDAEISQIFDGIMARPPTIVSKPCGNLEVQSTQAKIRFYFHPESQTGSYYRLLLHSVCQFHGLRANSNNYNGLRVLTVTGVFSGVDFELVGFVKSYYHKNMAYAGRENEPPESNSYVVVQNSQETVQNSEWELVDSMSSLSVA
eukprot:CAMPEP_0116018258 /NCGR_PEP_ID=MMETSP0321-20121206/8540_1 /TAXON_ID=163516 /ORGANISM="Leptocylindrus danicus var. danicus, Strain B650" /LENGTH=341 /DNA_ID=CAMNT_0003488615 /DNA_START=289 /DNA_END=1314 /DNA_ORIENTATION=+